MYWIIILSLVGADTTQYDREWLLSRLVIDRGFTLSEISSVERQLLKMSPAQVKEVIAAYKIQQGQIGRREWHEQNQTYNMAVENLEMMKTYRDYLARLYQFKLGIKRKEVNLMRQETNWMNYNSYNPYFRSHFRNYPPY